MSERTNNKTNFFSNIGIFDVSAICGLIYYPFYRTFAKNRLISINKDVNSDKFLETKQKIKRLGYYRGGLSYFISNIYLLNSYSSPDLHKDNRGLFLTAQIANIILQYPFHVNSLLRACDLPGYTNMNDPRGIIKMLTTKENYKGFLKKIQISFLMFVPFINLFCHRMDSARLAYVYGHHFGMDFKSYSDAKYYFKSNPSFLIPGRLQFNIFVHLYNFSVILLSAFIFSTYSSEGNSKKKI